MYILLTARCPLSCSFCMTKHLHRDEDLELNEIALRSLHNLSAVSYKVCLSGEGDPLVKWESILQIIESNPENIHYELITSSFWNKSKTEEFLNTLSSLCTQKKSTLAYRISIDEFHEKEINRDVLEILLSIFLKNDLKNITLQIRSLTGQEDYLFDRLKQLFTNYNIPFSINQHNEIEYKVTSEKVCIEIQFKPAVNPERFDYTDDWHLDKYVGFLEKNRNSPFHLGLLNSSVSNPIFDIAVNPNGDVVLYGVEPFILGNITKEVFDYELIKRRVSENLELHNLVTTRFIELIQTWRENKQKAELIEKVNNPFWVVRYLNDENLLHS